MKGTLLEEQSTLSAYVFFLPLKDMYFQNKQSMMPLGITGLEWPFTSLIFTNLRTDQQHNMTLSYIETHSNQSWNMETMGRSLTAFSKLWHQVSHNSALRNSMNDSPTPNITQTGHQILTVQAKFHLYSYVKYWLHCTKFNKTCNYSTAYYDSSYAEFHWTWYRNTKSKAESYILPELMYDFHCINLKATHIHLPTPSCNNVGFLLGTHAVDLQPQQRRGRGVSRLLCNPDFFRHCHFRKAQL